METTHLRVSVPSIVFSALCPMADLLFSCCLLQEEAILMICEQGTDLQVLQNATRKHFIAMFIQQNTIWVFPKFMDYVVSGSCTFKQFRVWVPSHGVGLKSDLGWLLSQILFHYCTSTSCWQVTIVEQRVRSQVGVYLSPLVLYLPVS